MFKRTTQTVADFGEELPADECRWITGVPSDFHPVYPMGDFGEVGIRVRPRGRGRGFVRNGNAKRHLAPGGDHPPRKATIRSRRWTSCPGCLPTLEVSSACSRTLLRNSLDFDRVAVGNRTEATDRRG